MSSLLGPLAPHVHSNVRVPADLSKFHIITMIMNPIRFESRHRIYHEWMEVMKHSGANIVTCELAFGNRPFMVTNKDNPNHVQLRSLDEVWLKENALNCTINYITQTWPDAREFAWIDADVFPMRTARDWIDETWHALQHYHFVQMFEYAMNLDPNYNTHGGKQASFLSAYVKSGYIPPTPEGDWYYYKHGHPGYAWAATREALDWTGGLFDLGILGAGDRHMALALIHMVEHSFPHDITSGYVTELLRWQNRCKQYIKKDVGFVPGTIAHQWHGDKKFRRYKDRWRILADQKYDPRVDLRRDTHGLFQLEVDVGDERQMRLRDLLRTYFRERNEDAI